jgi:hypothetical protein
LCGRRRAVFGIGMRALAGDGFARSVLMERYFGIIREIKEL